MQNQGLQNQLNVVNSHIASLEHLLHSIQSNAVNTQPDSSKTVGRSTNLPVRHLSYKTTMPPTHYCWYHSRTINPKYVSMTCLADKTGNDVTTTVQATKEVSMKLLELLLKNRADT